MIKLIQYPPHFGLPNASPFCLKMETYLRMANIPYESVFKSDPRKAPKHKFPIIEDNGRQIADSTLCIEYLKQTYGDKLDSQLTDLQKADALCLQRLIEEHLYWALIYSRWLDPHFWPYSKRVFFGKLPAFPRMLISNMVRKNLARDIISHGTGRHTPAEIYRFGCDDLKALATKLNAQPYFMGNEPTSIDACAYGFLANVIYPPIESPLKKFALTQTNLVAYCDRIKASVFA